MGKSKREKKPQGQKVEQKEETKFSMGDQLRKAGFEPDCLKCHEPINVGRGQSQGWLHNRCGNYPDRKGDYMRPQWLMNMESVPSAVVVRESV